MALKPRVVSYMRSVARSTAYSVGDVIKDNTPYLTSLFKETKESTKEIYQSIKDFSSGKTTDIVSTGKEALDNVFKNLKADLKSGNFYNKERDSIMDTQMARMMGFDFDMGDMDFSFDDSFDFDNPDDDITDGDALIVKQNAKNAAATI